MPRRRPESRRCPAAGGRYPRPAASLRAALQARGTAGRRKEGAGGRSPAASGSRRRAAGFGGRRGHAARTGGAGSVARGLAGVAPHSLLPPCVRVCKRLPLLLAAAAAAARPTFSPPRSVSGEVPRSSLCSFKSKYCLSMLQPPPWGKDSLLGGVSGACWLQL
ncbi:uncharacterized protein LOC120506059 isoform X3 [Passer montanus]|uniref:uncharacterized protein LOC120506059 isoform X3 n=1 Tax=Passer montanus TaxID=9160 RepID=UPI0019618DB6|nr:uncharacterized protein LOC120506059 isoform X3 [Passer montanus]